MTTRQQLAALTLNWFADEPKLERSLMGISPRGRQFVLDMGDPAAQIGPTEGEAGLISAGWIRAQSQLLLYAERRNGGVFVAAGDPWGWLRAYAEIQNGRVTALKQDAYPANQCTLPFRLVSPVSMNALEMEALTERWLAIGKSCAQWSDTGIPRDGGEQAIQC